MQDASKIGHIFVMWSHPQNLHSSAKPNAVFSVIFFKQFDICECSQAIHIFQGVPSRILQIQSKENLLYSKSSHSLHIVQLKFMKFCYLFVFLQRANNEMLLILLETYFSSSENTFLFQYFAFTYVFTFLIRIPALRK